MRFLYLAMALSLPALLSVPVQAGRTGDGCEAWVNQALTPFFKSEDELEAARTSGKDALCRLLAEQDQMLDIVVRTIATCAGDDENRKLLPEIEVLRQEKVAIRAEHQCPEPANVGP